MKITGTTRIRFILGDPVQQIIASHNSNLRYEADGLDVAVCPLHVRAEDLETVVQSIRCMHNVIGFGITIPHKIAILPLLDSLTERAALIGSVNTIARRPDGSLLGDNVDGQGYLDGLTRDGVDVRGLRVLQFGAGGAGRAVAFSLASAGAAELVIRNRNMERAIALAQDVARAYPACMVRASDLVAEDDVRQAEIIVNTTSQGMHAEDACLFDYSVLAAHQVVSDIIMVPELTPLLKAGKDAGCLVAYGKRMTEAQYPLVCALLGIDRPHQVHGGAEV